MEETGGHIIMEVISFRPSNKMSKVIKYNR